ncbi:hypothetical protein Vretimale_18285, partial [Volvox reticuliferus]
MLAATSTLLHICTERICVLCPHPMQAASAGAAVMVGWSSHQARRLFDKDSPHEEPLLTAQLAGWTLRALLVAPQQRLQTADGGNSGNGAGPSISIAWASGSALTAATPETAAVLTADGSARLARWSTVAVEQLRAVETAVAAASGNTHGRVLLPRLVVAAMETTRPTKDGWLGGLVVHAPTR